ncbi:MAG: cation:proton antiporter domain-containing protein [Candidatus Methylomirabilia bacterium]
MEPESFVLAAVFLLLVTSVTVALAKRFGLGSVIGLLVAGVIIGPHSPGPALTHNVEDLRRFTELGVVLLLFVIGLELQPARLAAMRREVFGVGTLQITLTGAAVTAYALLGQQSWQAALIIGLSLALSSTAFVMQLLRERGEISTPHGTTAFSVLLMQDLAVVPIMALVPLLAGGDALGAGLPIAEQLALVAGMLVLVVGFGRYVAPFALERLARQGNREGFLLVVMLSVFLAAWAVHEAGASMALGAFMMGLLLSGSRYHLQIQALIEPFKGLLMSVFFVAVGMSVDLGAIGARPGAFVRDLAVILLLKILAMGVVGWLFGLGRAVTVRVSFLLAQGGEFGFVLFGSARALGVLDDAAFVTGIGVISVSMLVTPLLAQLGEAVARRWGSTPAATDDLKVPAAGGGAPRVIIGGYGRVGHTVAAVLSCNGIPFLAVDTDPARVARGKADGFPVFYGDIGDPELLSAAGAGRVDLVVLTIDQEQAALRAVILLRSAWPALPVIARARDLAASGRLLEAGATQAYPEAVESSLRLAGNTLQMIGFAGGDVDRALGDARTCNYALVRPDPEAAGKQSPD